MLEQYEATLDSWIESHIETANDDEMFACGYLQGHVAVAIANIEASGDHSNSALFAEVEALLETAKTELSPADFQLVANAWQSLAAQMA